MYLRIITQEKKELLNVGAMEVVQHHMKKKRALVAEVVVAEMTVEAEEDIEVVEMTIAEMIVEAEEDIEVVMIAEMIVEAEEDMEVVEMMIVESEEEKEIDLMLVVVAEMIVVVEDAKTTAKEAVIDLITTVINNNVNVLPVLLLNEDVTTAVVAREIKATTKKDG